MSEEQTCHRLASPAYFCVRYFSTTFLLGTLLPCFCSVYQCHFLFSPKHEACQDSEEDQPKSEVVVNVPEPPSDEESDLDSDSDSSYVDPDATTEEVTSEEDEVKVKTRQDWEKDKK